MKFEWNEPRIGEKQENEVVCYTVAVGNLPIPPFVRKNSKKAIKFIQGLEGFVGFYPYYPHGTLCIFRTENQAKVAKNMMENKGIKTGNNICEIFVEKKYMEET